MEQGRQLDLYSETEQRRVAIAKKFAGLGVATAGAGVRVVREGSRVTVYTVGYEKRDGKGLINALRDQGVKALADVRERPMSRKPDFRAAALRTFCERVGIEYQPWPMLGSTVEQRDELQASGDFQQFERQFRSHAAKSMKADLAKLAETVTRVPTALMCYERLHEECHRSVIADLVAESINATVAAIL
jgi:uncharacterized protein (DUF488 family)